MSRVALLPRHLVAISSALYYTLPRVAFCGNMRTAADTKQHPACCHCRRTNAASVCMHFHDFAQVAEQLAATTKKLEKAALLKDYFAALSDQDLALAARFLAGRPFALADERVLNV